MKPRLYAGLAACGICLCLNTRSADAQDIVKDAKAAATQAAKTVKKAVHTVENNGPKTVRTASSLAGKTAGTGVSYAGKAARVTKAQALKMAATPSWDTLKTAYDYQAGPPDDMKEEPADTDSAMVLKLTFTGCNGKPVEGVFMRPKAEGTYPVALLPHGLTNNKEIAVKMFGNALVAKGIAVLALDAPGHGHNEPANKSYWNKQVITLAVHEGDRNYRRALDYLATRPDVDMDRVGLLGYSMGSIMGSILGSVDDRVKAFAFCVGGDPFLPIAHATIDDGQRTSIMQVCPSLYIRHIPGHPIIMFNGLKDVVVVAPAAKILQNAAPKPSQVVWYDGGHDVPDAIRTRAVAWLTKQLKPEGEAAPKDGDSKEGDKKKDDKKEDAKKDDVKKDGDQKAAGDQQKTDQKQ